MAGLALLGAALWGVGDFLGGFAARRARVLVVLVGSQVVGLTGAVAWVVASGDGRPALHDVWPALGAGVAGALGLAALYRGLATGAMGVVAPISSASPVVPLAIDVVRGITPSTAQWVGTAAVLSGIALLARDTTSVSRRAGLAAGVGLALVAALGFGLFLVGIDAAADASVPWAIAFARGGSVLLGLLMVVALRPPLPRLAVAPLIVAVGLLDTCANILIALATTRGAVGVVGVLSSLYPLTTVVLARVVLGERLNRTRRLGAVAALAGAALVATG